MSVDDTVKIINALTPNVLSACTLIAAILAYFKSVHNEKKIAEISTQSANEHSDTVERLHEVGKELIVTKEHVNSRMTEMMDLLAKEQRAKGVLEGVEQGVAQELKRQTDLSLVAAKLSPAETK